MAELDPHYFPNLKDSLDKIILDNITSVTLNTDALRVNFEAIITILKGLVKRVDTDKGNAVQTAHEVESLKEKLKQLEEKQTSDKDELNEKISDTNSELRETKENTDKNTQDIEKLQAALNELTNSNNDLSKAYENSQNDLNAANERLDNHDKRIQDILQQLANAGSSDSKKPATPLAAVPSDSSNKKEVDNLKKDLSDMKKNFENQIAELNKLLEDFVKKDEYNEFKDQAEYKLRNHQESIDDLYNQIGDINTRLSDKLNGDNFDEHVNDYNNIKNLVINLANKEGNSGDSNKTTTIVQQLVQSGSSLSTKDANLLKELGQKFPEFEALLKKLSKEFGEHVVTFRTYADESNRKIHNNDENIKNLKADTNKRISDLEAAIRSLRDQILNFSTLPVPTTTAPTSSSSSSNANNSTASDMNTAEIRRIQMALTTINERISGVENNISELQRLKEKVHGIQEVVYENKHKIGNIEEELAELRSLRARVELLEQLFRDREREIKSSGGKGGRATIIENHGVGGGLTAEQVRQMIDEEIRKLRDELLALIEALRAELAKKADAEDLWKSEAALLEKLDQIAGALMKRAQADKSDTKKALMFLEKKIKEITVVIFGGAAQGEDGAMFSKKPWNPWSCASCDSKLKELPGALVDHKNWNKLPQRETSPGRMTQGKFGKGWTKWADNKKSSGEKVREVHSSGKGDTLPEINGREHVKSQMESSGRINE